MKGTYTIHISTKRVEWSLTIHRNITIIRGDSGTGKTTLVQAVNRYFQNPTDSGVKISCKKVCRTISDAEWLSDIERTKDNIIFIDESSRFLRSASFARAVRESDNYYVIATRADIETLPYSVNEIYGFRQRGGILQAERVFNEAYHLYREYNMGKAVKPELVITEDSNAGNDFFSKVLNNKGVDCKSANGKSNVISKCRENKGKRIFVFVDGAAYGSQMSDTIILLNEQKNIVLYAPESFEWLILNSGLFKSNELESILNNPSDYIESQEYFSWERFFNALLETVTDEDNRVKKYSKTSKMETFYLNDANSYKILQQIATLLI